MKPNLVSILANPERDWRAFRAKAEGSSRLAYRKLDVDWSVYNIRDYLFTHDTIVASVATEPDGYTIKKGCWELVNANGNAWTNEVLLSCYKTFIGGENYCEHVQVPSLSMGKILDAVIREVTHNGERIYMVDILVATNRIHADLVRRIESGELNTLSMGANAKYVQCSVCGKLIDTVKDEPSCEHLANHIGEVVEYKGRSVKCAELCGGIDPKTKEYIKGSCTFIEASWVECPAFEGAVTNFIIETPEVRKRREEIASLENLFRASSFSSMRVADAHGRMQLNVAKRLMAETEHIERLQDLESAVARQIIKRCNNCTNVDS